MPVLPPYSLARRIFAHLRRAEVGVWGAFLDALRQTLLLGEDAALPAVSSAQGASRLDQGHLRLAEAFLQGCRGDSGALRTISEDSRAHPAQRREAALALAELSLATGDAGNAREALERLAAGAPAAPGDELAALHAVHRDWLLGRVLLTEEGAVVAALQHLTAALDACARHDDEAATLLRAAIHQTLAHWYRLDGDDIRAVLHQDLAADQRSAPAAALGKDAERFLSRWRRHAHEAPPVIRPADAATERVAEPTRHGEWGAPEGPLFSVLRDMLACRASDQLIARILQVAIEISRAERGFLLIQDERGLTVRHSRAQDGAAVPDALREFSRGVVEEALATRQTVTAVDAGRDRRFEALQSVAHLRLASVVCVPFVGEAGAIGALYLDNRARAGLFDAKKLPALEAFTAIAAQVLERQHTLERLHEQQQRLQAQHQEIQALNARLRDKAAHEQARAEDAEARLRDHELSEGTLERLEGLIGASPPMQEVYRLISLVAPTALPVFIAGESGTGKELVARALHALSDFAKAPFVSANCAAFPEALLESELFGHVKGAFTGAHRDQDGLFTAAHGGTLFLDEIADCAPPLQAKLLTALESGEIRPVGATESRRVQVRIVTATHRDLARMIADGAFREDLFYRIHVAPITLPPLRERSGDVARLLDHFLSQVAKRRGEKPHHLTAEALALMESLPWPGNVRQLRHAAQRLALEARGPRIDEADLKRALPDLVFQPGAFGNAPLDANTLRQARDACDRRMVIAALQAEDFNIAAAARRLGVQRKQLYRVMERLGLEVETAARLRRAST